MISLFFRLMITLPRDEEICVGDRKTNCRRKKKIKMSPKKKHFVDNINNQSNV